MRKASTCSVTVIEPISAAMPAPTRVANIRAQMVAAKSLTSSSKNVAPSWLMSGMTRKSCNPPWYTTIMPMKLITTHRNTSD
jgi:hypothetical protein